MALLINAIFFLFNIDDRIELALEHDGRQVHIFTTELHAFEMKDIVFVIDDNRLIGFERLIEPQFIFRRRRAARFQYDAIITHTFDIKLFHLHFALKHIQHFHGAMSQYLPIFGIGESTFATQKRRRHFEMLFKLR